MQPTAHDAELPVSKNGQESQDIEGEHRAVVSLSFLFFVLLGDSMFAKLCDECRSY